MIRRQLLTAKEHCCKDCEQGKPCDGKSKRNKVKIRKEAKGLPGNQQRSYDEIIAAHGSSRFGFYESQGGRTYSLTGPKKNAGPLSKRMLSALVSKGYVKLVKRSDPDALPHERDYKIRSRSEYQAVLGVEESRSLLNYDLAEEILDEMDMLPANAKAALDKVADLNVRTYAGE